MLKAELGGPLSPLVSQRKRPGGHRGYVYRGSAIPDLVGRYLYGDFELSRFWTLTYSGESAGRPQVCDDYEITADLAAASFPTAFGEDSAGELYVLTFNGAIFRVDPG